MKSANSLYAFLANTEPMAGDSVQRLQFACRDESLRTGTDANSIRHCAADSYSHLEECTFHTDTGRHTDPSPSTNSHTHPRLPGSTVRV